MAIPEYLEILKQGVEAWNQWRWEYRDISPDLREANLRAANLHQAFLSDADFSQANLSRANLNGANLTGADLSRARLNETVFGNTNLTAVHGLDTCSHRGPSTLDHR